MTPRARRAMRVALAPTVVAAAVGSGAACSTPGDPGVPFAVEFTRLPWPSVVAGDTLRDSTGATAAPTVVVLDARSDTVRSAAVSFVVLDTGVRVIAGNRFVPVQWRETPVRVVAEAGGVQSRPLSLLVTRRPDTLVAAATAVPVLRYTPVQTPSSNISGAVQVRLRSRQVVPGAGVDSAVRGWLVDFAVVSGPSATLVDSVQLVGEATIGRAQRDTTDATGTAGIRVRVFPRPGQTATDSVVLSATARHRGLVVAGSPLRLVVRLARDTT
jgi:hypothetical protein